MPVHPIGHPLSLPLPEPVAPIAATNGPSPVAGTNLMSGSAADVNSSALGRLAASDLAKLNAMLESVDLSGAKQPHTLAHLTALARSDADTYLLRATEIVESSGVRALGNWQTRPDALIAAAQTLFDAGGYANYICSAYLAQTIVEQTSLRLAANSARAPFEATRALRRNVDNTWAIVRQSAGPRLVRLWWRAPLLLLLLVWLALGVATGPFAMVLRNFFPQSSLSLLLGSFYQFWGLGFLVLVGLGFWARVRKSCF